MGKIIPLFANCQLSPTEQKTVEATCSRVAEFYAEHGDFDYDVHVIFSQKPNLTSPVAAGYVASGYTYHSCIIAITLEQNLQDFAEPLFQVLCHEMAHSLRWEKNGEFGGNLYNDLIFEGLAVNMEEFATRGWEPEQRWRGFSDEITSSSKEAKQIYQILQPHFQNANYDNDAFFYRGNEQLPKYAGYKLGYYLVKKFLRKRKISIFEADILPYQKFQNLKP